MQKLIGALARGMALLGGTVLLGLILLTCLSIVGRSLNGLGHSTWLASLSDTLATVFRQLGPIDGDFELIEAGVAFAVLAFLPWSLVERSHATVDLFTSRLSPRIQRLLNRLWDLVFALVLVVITWRLLLGTLDKRRYGETTLMLEYPVWWGFAACTVAAAVASLVGLYRVVAGEAPTPHEPDEGVSSDSRSGEAV